MERERKKKQTDWNSHTHSSLVMIMGFNMARIIISETIRNEEV